ncbi:MAG: carbohydrate ABC transporter permease [Anaerolineae bacterium]|nr:carbohydrate ABC transporter permease [Anaerolineae bacterium]
MPDPIAARRREPAWVRPLRMAPRVVVVYSLLGLLVVFMIGPYLFIFGTAFKETYTLVSIPPKIIPDQPTLENFRSIFSTMPFGRWFLNSTVVATASTLGTLLVCSMAGYTFAKKDFYGKGLLFSILLATLMIPGALMLVPAFLVTNALGLVNSYGGLILPSVGGAMGVFLLRQFIETLPSELEQAALIDGASEVGVFVRIILPLAKPGLATLAILSFTGSWNSLIWPLVIVNSKRLYTLPLGLALLRTEFQVNYGATSAAAVVSVVPLVAAFSFLQRYFIEGLTVGALKG